MKPKPSQYELDMIAMRERIALNNQLNSEVAALQVSQDALDILHKLEADVKNTSVSLDQMAKYLEHSADMIDNLYNLVDTINKRIARYERRYDGVGET